MTVIITSSISFTLRSTALFLSLSAHLNLIIFPITIHFKNFKLVWLQCDTSNVFAHYNSIIPKKVQVSDYYKSKCKKTNKDF